MKSYFVALTLLSVLLLSNSCEVLKSEDLNPFYLKIDSVSVQVGQNQGAATHNIRDVWVYTVDQTLGPFELPVTIPVLATSETTEFTIFAGIRSNGQESAAITYEYMQPYTLSLTTQEGQIYEVSPVFEYYDSVLFDFIEDFEGNHTFTAVRDEYEGSELTIEIEPGNNRVANFHVDIDNPVCEVYTASTFLASNYTNNAYLEIDYKGNAPLIVGIYKNTVNILQAEYIILLKEQTEFNKLYLDMSPYITDPILDQFSILLRVDIDGYGVDSADVVVDNIKLLRF